MRIENYFFTGVGSENTRQKIKELFLRLGIKNPYYLKSTSFIYCVKENTVNKYFKGNDFGRPVEILSQSDYLQILKEDFMDLYPEMWWALLTIGDTVTIRKRNGCSTDYPFDFVDGMANYSGKSFTINTIYYRSDIKKEPRKYYNGDDHEYGLKEIGYAWHSSMFEEPIISSCTKLDLSNLTILSKIL